MLFDLHGQYFDSNATDQKASENAKELFSGVELHLVENNHSSRHPHHHDEGLENRHHFQLVVLLYRDVQ